MPSLSLRNQCRNTGCGNPFPFMSRFAVIPTFCLQKETDSQFCPLGYTSDIGHWFGMTDLGDL